MDDKSCTEYHQIICSNLVRLESKFDHDDPILCDLREAADSLLRVSVRSKFSTLAETLPDYFTRKRHEMAQER